MNSPRPTAVAALPLKQMLCCLGSGAVMGQVVLGLAARHQGALAGLVLSLIFVGAGITSMLMFMTHLHQTRATKNLKKGPLPLKTWVCTLSAGLLAAIYLQPVLLPLS